MSSGEAESPVIKVTSSEHFQQLLSKDLERVSLIYFWATWAAASKDMKEVVKELADKYPRVLVLDVCFCPSSLSFFFDEHFNSDRSRGTTGYHRFLRDRGRPDVLDPSRELVVIHNTDIDLYIPVSILGP
jgi:hypothetical protein